MDWKPTERQIQALKCTADEVLFGGARGGGKTDTGMAWMLYDIENPKYRGLVLRKNQIDLREWIERAKVFYSRNKAEFINHSFHFPSGAIIWTGHLKDSNAYMKYQGGEYHRILIEELSQIASEEQYLALKSSNRSTVPGIVARMFNTTNPDYPGLDWIRNRWKIPSNPDFSKIYETVSDEGIRRVFIPSKIEDNPHLASDRNYIATLEEWKKVDPSRYQAWRHGNWGGYKRSGVVYDEFDRQRHVTEEWGQTISERVGAIDWGYTHPAAVLDIYVNNEGDKPSFYVARQWYKVGRNSDDAIDAAISFGCNKYYPDKENAEACDSLRKRGVKVVDIDKTGGSVIGGINMVKLALMENRLHVHPSCVDVINEFNNYIWKEGKVDTPLKEIDHAMDALRYVIYNYDSTASNWVPAATYQQPSFV